MGRLLVSIAAVGVLLYLLWSIWDHAGVMTWIERAPPLPFFGIMAVVTAFGVPMTPFFIFAGATFGTRVGLIGSGAALALNLTLGYWVARSGLRPHLESLLHRFGYELPNFAAKDKGGVRFTVMVKLAPGIPAFLKNWGLAVSGVPFPLFFVLSMAISGAYGALLVILGESLLEHATNRTVLIAAIVVVAALALWWWHRRRGRGAEPWHPAPGGQVT